MSVYTVLGEHTVLCEKKIDDILKKENISLEDVNRYDMQESVISEVLFDVQSVAFLSPKKAIILKNPEFLTGIKKEREHDVEALLNYLANPSKENILIIHAAYEKLDERKKIVKELRKKSTFITFETYSEPALKKWFSAKLTGLGIEFDALAIESVMKRTGGKLDLLSAELEKIEIYFLGSKEKLYSQAVAASLSPRRLEDNVFQLTEYLVAGKILGAHGIYMDLLQQNEEPFKLLVMIASQFRLMKQIIRLAGSGYPQPEITKILGIHPYRVKIIMGQSHRYDVHRLEELLKQIAQMDYQIKRGLLDKNLAVEMLILMSA